MRGEAMVGFGRKQAWLAIREGDATSAAEILDLTDLGPVSWRAGTDLAYFTDDRVVLTPPLPGAGASRWLLVAGRAMLRAEVRPDVTQLSTMLGTEVQFFSTYRVAELHCWERAVGGVLTRAFSYVGHRGEVTTWRGPPDGIERDLGLPAALAENTVVVVSEDDVLRVAAAWSIDPSTLDGRPAPAPLRAAAQKEGHPLNA